MDNLWQQALADEIRAELARQGVSQRRAYLDLSISSTAWQSYFKRLERDVPSGILIDVARYLGLPLSELIRRTEARAAELAARESGSGVNVDRILTDSPHLEAVREEGLRMNGRRATGE